MAINLTHSASRWWRRLTRSYVDDVVDPRRPGRAVEPLPRPEMLDRFEGMWVAVVDNEVVAAEHTSHNLALRLHDMDHRRRRRAVVEYVRPRTSSYIVGVG